MKKRILSGMQPSGKPHIGNYFGAMKQHIEMQEEFDTFLFIADLHTLTTVRNKEEMQRLTFELALTYLALGLNPEKAVFFKQSDIPYHTELCWIFDCITSVSFLERAHAWKDAKEKQKKDITVGLFNYPILMAADILLYDPDLVPVGKDQKQHVEIARDIAENFNNTFGEVFKLPEEYIKPEVGTIPGIDGQKMSKSYKNTIEIFANEEQLKKQIMSIKTDSTPIDQPKNPDSCNVFNIYKLFANNQEKEEMKQFYAQPGFGYGDAKKTLLKKVLEYFGPYRDKFVELSTKKDFIYDVLREGSKKAKKVSEITMQRAREKIGYVAL